MKNLPPPGRSLAAVAAPLRIAAVAAGCYLAVRAGHTFTVVGDHSSPVWPPAGVAVALTWWLGPIALPGVLLGIWLAVAQTATGPILALPFGLGYAAMAGASLLLLQRWTRERDLLESLPGLLRFATLGAGLATLVPASVGIMTLVVARRLAVTDAGSAWLTWWLGDAMGVVVFAPLFLAWRRPEWRWTPGRMLEAGALLLGLLASGAVVFLLGAPQISGDAPLAFLVYPCVIWAGLSFSAPGAATAVGLLVAMTLAGTTRGLGPFGRFNAPQAFWLIQIYIACLATTAHVLAATAAQRRRAKARLREQATLLDKATDAIIVRALDDSVLYWNQSAARIYGHTAAEMIGRDATPLLYKDPAPYREVKHAVLTRGEWVGELQMRTKAGEERTLLSRCTRLLDEAGAPHGILAINTDITERKRFEAHFLRSQRMESIGTLAGGIAHDLNNVLAPIVMGLPLVREHVHDRVMIETLAAMESSARRGADIIKQVLLFARGAASETQLLQLSPLVRDVSRMIRETFPKSLSVAVHCPDTLWPILGDSTQLHQVLLNLCVNARDAMAAGGSLRVEAANLTLDTNYAGLNPDAKPGAYVAIDVIDTGVGIPPELREKIFEPFFTTKEVGRGTGLGLATSLAIVRSHGGFIHVYSEVDRGSTFRVYLPARPDSLFTADAEPEPLPRGHGDLVLVVDDEQAILTTLSRALERHGYRVLTARDGAEAVALYARHGSEIAVVITDMMMPVMDGPATIVALQRLNPQVRIIGASGLDANGKVAKAAGSGVKHFLPKPYSATTLLCTLHEVIDAGGA